MNGASLASFLAAAEPADPPDRADLLALHRAQAPRLSCCGRYARRATIRSKAREPGGGYYEEVEVATCPDHGERELL